MHIVYDVADVLGEIETDDGNVWPGMRPVFQAMLGADWRYQYVGFKCKRNSGQPSKVLY